MSNPDSIKIGLAQEEILYDQLIQPTSTLYNTSQIYEIKGTVDAGIMEKSIQYLLTNNSIFNSCLIEKNASFFWELNTFQNQYEFNPQYLNGYNYESFLEWCKADNQKLFDLLSKEPLYKIIGIQLVDRFIIYAKFHHIWMDANGLGIFIQKLSSIYNHYIQHATEEPTVYLGDYKHFITAQEDYLLSEQYNIDKAFWSKYLTTNAHCFQEPIGRLNANKIKANQSAIRSLSLNRIAFDALFQRLKENKVNDFHYALVVLYCSLRKVFQVKSLNLSCPNANRFTQEAKETVGHFTSVKPLLIDVDLNHCTPNTLIQQIKEDRWASHNQQQYPFSHIIRELQAEDVDFSNLRNVNFSYERQLYSFPFEEQLNDEFRIYPVNNNAAIRISFTNRHVDKDPKVWFMCQEDLFSPEEIAYFIKTFEKLYFLLINQLDSQIESILQNTKVLTDSEEQFLLTSVNKQLSHQANSKTIVDLFAAQVAKMPDHIALVHQGNTLTLSELHNKSNQLANYILSKDVKPESIIGLLFEPSFEMIIGILGVLKAGCAYLPLDPDLPASRKSFMLKDCNCSLLLSQSDLAVPEDYGGAIVQLDIENLDAYSIEQPNIQIHPNQLAYIIYTSGTTGQPKGAMLTHKNIANFTHWFVEESNISWADKTILLLSYSFDASYLSIFSCFVTGCTLFLVPREEVLNADVLLDFIEMNGISFFNTTPLYFNILFNKPISGTKKFSKLRLIGMGGEAIRVDDIKKFLSEFSDIKLMNIYGPTETTIGSVTQIIDFESVDAFIQNPTVGKPIANTQIYLLDSYSQLVPYGVEGEIYIGGDGLARGYLNREDLTKDKFIGHPYKPGERLYRTGDRGRWMPNGNLAFLGRKDEQVKIRGYRIELGEIEAVLLKHEAVDACVVVANNKRDAQNELIAYTTGTANTGDLRDYLGDKLPIYMVPTHFVHLDSIPFNSNGKINKKALPQPIQKRTNDAIFYPARTLTEKTLVKIWSELLEIPIDKIHLNADFFELGGNSILAIQLVRKIKTEVQVELDLKTIYSESTLFLLSLVINKKDKNSSNPNLLHFCSSIELRYIFYIPPFTGFPAALDILFNNLSGYNAFGFIYTKEEDFVDFCTNSILKIAKNATYISLVGVCTGGQLAFSIIQKLEQKGVHVDLLLMYESKFKKDKLLFTDPELEMALGNWSESLKEDRYKYTGNTNNYNEVVKPSANYTFNHVIQGKIKSTIINLSTIDNIFNVSFQKSWKKACSQYFVTLIEGTHANMLVEEFRELNNLIALNIYNLEKKGRFHLSIYLLKEKVKYYFLYLKQLFKLTYKKK